MSRTKVAASSSPDCEQSFLDGHSALSSASSRHSGGKQLLTGSDPNLGYGSAHLLVRRAVPGSPGFAARLTGQGPVVGTAVSTSSCLDSPDRQAVPRCHGCECCGGSVGFQQRQSAEWTSEREGFIQNPQTFRRAFFLAVAGIVAASAVNVLRAQAPATDTIPPAFEVASVKPNKSGSNQTNFSPQPGGRFTATNVSVLQMIRIAYSTPVLLPFSNILGGPNWISSDHFDITAEAEGNPT